jgi:hypothetical protein
MSEAITTLWAFADLLVAQLPSEPCKCEVRGSRWGPHFAFSRENLPAPPSLLRTDDIIATRTEHRYGNNVTIDVVHFYASGRTYRQLAILILAALFSEGCERAELELSNRQSRIRRVEIHTGDFRNKLCWGYQVRPERFTYHPQIPERWPRNWKLEERNLPSFDLDFVEGQPRHPINDLDKRDRLEIRGQDEGLMVVAELFLNIGLPVCSQNAINDPIPPDMTYVLESFPGHRRVSPWSAEAQFHLPGSFSWPGEYPSI